MELTNELSNLFDVKPGCGESPAGWKQLLLQRLIQWGWAWLSLWSVNACVWCVRHSQEEERKRQEELDRQRRERRYILPDEPTILVNPNWAAKNGKFDCSIMSLSVLLDYRLEDNKEHSFEVRIISGFFPQTYENSLDWMCAKNKNSTLLNALFLQVSLFAELFNEMLQRDFGYRIYKALAAIPTKDEKKEKKNKKEVEKWEAKKEKDEENEEPQAKKAKEDEEDKKKVNLFGLFSSECFHAAE